MRLTDADPFVEQDGILVRKNAVAHRDKEYDPRAFDTLLEMQQRHFWYRGRHRFLLTALERELQRQRRPVDTLSAIDLGGGCGGWLAYLHSHRPARFTELALGDSSLTALDLAAPVVAAFAGRYAVDLLDLGWHDRWDVVFLLDVLEHIPDHAAVLRQIRDSLRPGGLLFVTTPALKFFWTYNDVLAKHQRRYARGDFAALADQCGLHLVRSRYFMFFLSPLLYLSRLTGPDSDRMSDAQARDRLRKTHRIPPRYLNAALTGIFALESHIGLKVPFPWGTSVLAVFRKSGDPPG